MNKVFIIPSVVGFILQLHRHRRGHSLHWLDQSQSQEQTGLQAFRVQQYTLVQASKAASLEDHSRVITQHRTGNIGSKWKPKRQWLTSLNILIKTNLPPTRLVQTGLGGSCRLQLSLISFTFSRDEEATLGVYEIASFSLSLKKKSYSDFLASNWPHCGQFFKLPSTPSGPKHCSPRCFLRICGNTQNF